MADKRGSPSIVLGGQRYPMAPTYGAMMKIEEMGELTVAELYQAHAAERLKLAEAGAIVWCGLDAATPNFFTYEAVCETLFEKRLTDAEIRKAIGAYLIELLWHPDDKKKRAAAAGLLSAGAGPDIPAS